MKLYVDLETLELIEGIGFRNPVTSLRFKRGDAAKLEVAFLANGSTPSSIGNPATLEIHFGAKPRGRFDVGYLVHTADWTMPDPEATSPAYQCSPSFNTVELDSALQVGSSTGTELSEITLMGEITWREGAGSPTSTRTFIVVVENDVNRGTEGVPESADPAYPAPQDVATNAALAAAVAAVHSGPPFATGLTAVAGDISVDAANGTFQMVTLTGSTMNRLLNVPVNGTVGMRFELWIHSTTGNARTLNFHASILKPSTGGPSLPVTLVQGATHVVVLRHNGTNWILGDVTDELGFTTVGRAIASVANPSLIRFLRVNADNTVSLLSDADMLTALGAAPRLVRKTSSFTAAAGYDYKTEGTAITVFDPTGSAGDSYTVTVVTGYAMVGTDTYYPSALTIIRYYDSIAYSWKTLVSPSALVRTSTFTAGVGGNYKTAGTSISVSDPTGMSTGDLYTVLVITGYISINGTYYYASAIPVVRYYDTTSYMWKTLAPPGAWTNKSSSFTANVGGAYMIDGNSMPSISDPSGATSGDTWCFMVPKGSAYVMGSMTTHYASTKVITRRYDGSNWRYGTENSDPANEYSSYLSLSLSHVGRYVLLQYSGSTTIYVPSDTSTYWPDGTEIRFRICQSGYTHSFSLGSGVTVNNSSALSSLVQHDEFRLRKISYNTWNFCKY